MSAPQLDSLFQEDGDVTHHCSPGSTTEAFVINTSDIGMDGLGMDGWDHIFEADGVNETSVFSASLLWALWVPGHSF